MSAALSEAVQAYRTAVAASDAQLQRGRSNLRQTEQACVRLEELREIVAGELGLGADTDAVFGATMMALHLIGG